MSDERQNRVLKSQRACAGAPFGDSRASTAGCGTDVCLDDIARSPPPHAPNGAAADEVVNLNELVHPLLAVALERGGSDIAAAAAILAYGGRDPSLVSEQVLHGTATRLDVAAYFPVKQRNFAQSWESRFVRDDRLKDYSKRCPAIPIESVFYSIPSTSAVSEWKIAAKAAALVSRIVTTKVYSPDFRMNRTNIILHSGKYSRASAQGTVARGTPPVLPGGVPFLIMDFELTPPEFREVQNPQTDYLVPFGIDRSFSEFLLTATPEVLALCVNPRESYVHYLDWVGATCHEIRTDLFMSVETVGSAFGTPVLFAIIDAFYPGTTFEFRHFHLFPSFVQSDCPRSEMPLPGLYRSGFYSSNRGDIDDPVLSRAPNVDVFPSLSKRMVPKHLCNEGPPRSAIQHMRCICPGSDCLNFPTKRGRVKDPSRADESNAPVDADKRA
jgi:hypothetical protein